MESSSARDITVSRKFPRFVFLLGVTTLCNGDVSSVQQGHSRSHLSRRMMTSATAGKHSSELVIQILFDIVVVAVVAVANCLENCRLL